MSAGRTTGQGCRIVMDDEPGESYIEHKQSGKRLPLEKKNNVFVLRAKVLKHGAERDWVMPLEESTHFKREVNDRQDNAYAITLSLV